LDLTAEQESVLAGESGAALGLAMRTLVDYGAAFGARRMVPIASAHLAMSFGVGFMSAYYKVLERLVAEGAKVKVPTTVNPRPGNELDLKNRVAFARQKKLERMFAALGVTPNYSCVCYEDANIPARGDVVVWAESSAVIYANSVLGARSNRNSVLVDICSAVTGWTPEFGYLLDENRRGHTLVHLDIRTMDAPALGFILGKRIVDKVPVLERHPFTRGEFKNMGGAMAASGAVAMFHVLGVTPEAPDIASVFDGPPKQEITVTQADLDALRKREPPDMVVFGCPQMMYEEAIAIGRHFAGRRVTRPTWFCMVPSALERFKGTDVYHQVKEAGVEVLPFCPVAALTIRQGLRTMKVLTASGKMYYYLEGSHYGSVEDCLRASGVLP
jgi:phosphomecalonate degydratase large subunit